MFEGKCIMKLKTKLVKTKQVVTQISAGKQISLEGCMLSKYQSKGLGVDIYGHIFQQFAIMVVTMEVVLDQTFVDAIKDGVA